MNEVAFSDAAQAEYERALEWYRAKHADTGDRFEAAVQAAVERVRQWPDSGVPVGRGRRFMAVSPYPYYLIYRAGPAGIVIAAVSHNRQSPRRWHRR